MAACIPFNLPDLPFASHDESLSSKHVSRPTCSSNSVVRPAPSTSDRQFCLPKLFPAPCRTQSRWPLPLSLRLRTTSPRTRRLSPLLPGLLPLPWCAISSLLYRCYAAVVSDRTNWRQQVAAYAWRRAATYVPKSGKYPKGTLPAGAYDAVIVGAGPSGSVCGHYLAKQGVKVRDRYRSAPKERRDACMSEGMGSYHMGSHLHALPTGCPPG